MLSPAGVSRYSERRSAEFATPKACLFRSMKYGNISAEPSVPSVSDHDRFMSVGLQLNSTQSVQTPAADACLSPGFTMLSPELYQTFSVSVPKQNVQSLTSGLEFTDKLPETTVPETTVAACRENSLTSDGNDTCAAEINCFRKPSTSQRR